jgi:hypothetical protein
MEVSGKGNCKLLVKKSAGHRKQVSKFEHAYQVLCRKNYDIGVKQFGPLDKGARGVPRSALKAFASLRGRLLRMQNVVFSIRC